MKLQIEGGNRLKSLLESGRNIIITAHQNPDGDAVGSAMGLYHALSNAGLHAQVIFPDKFPAFYAWVPSVSGAHLFSENPSACAEKIAGADILFCLDYNEPGRTGTEMGKCIADSPATKIMIDHHPDPHPFCQYTISSVSDCSTAQLVFRFLYTLEMDSHITAQSATALYMGIMTDTGSFRFPATTAMTHLIVARLIEHGANNASIHEAVYDQNTESRIRLTGFAFSEKMVVLREHSTAYFWLTREELKRFQYQSGDTEGLVNYGLSIQGIRLAAIFLETEDCIKLSFRSKGNVPVNTLMRENFSGGGHKNAAGGRSFSGLHETLEKFLSIIPVFMKNHA